MGRGPAAQAARPERKPPGQPPGTPQPAFDLLAVDHRLLATLAAHNGPAGICPRIPRLAGLLGVSARYVRQRLAELERAGLVERIPVFERDDDPQWRRRREAGMAGEQPRRQTSNSYRLRHPPGTHTNPVGNAIPAGHPPGTRPLLTAESVPPLIGKAQAVSGHQGSTDEDELSLVPPGPVEIDVDPPEALQLAHQPSLAELLATLDAGFGHVQVLDGATRPATYRTARGRVIDLATAPAADVHRAVDQLDRHTCRGGPCRNGEPCRRHAPRRRGRR